MILLSGDFLDDDSKVIDPVSKQWNGPMLGPTSEQRNWVALSWNQVARSHLQGALARCVVPVGEEVPNRGQVDEHACAYAKRRIDRCNIRASKRRAGAD